MAAMRGEPRSIETPRRNNPTPSEGGIFAIVPLSLVTGNNIDLKAPDQYCLDNVAEQRHDMALFMMHIDTVILELRNELRALNTKLERLLERTGENTLHKG